MRPQTLSKKNFPLAFGIAASDDLHHMYLYFVPYEHLLSLYSQHTTDFFSWPHLFTSPLFFLPLAFGLLLITSTTCICISSHMNICSHCKANIPLASPGPTSSLPPSAFLGLPPRISWSNCTSKPNHSSPVLPSSLYRPYHNYIIHAGGGGGGPFTPDATFTTTNKWPIWILALMSDTLSHCYGIAGNTVPSPQYQKMIFETFWSQATPQLSVPQTNFLSVRPHF